METDCPPGGTGHCNDECPFWINGKCCSVPNKLEEAKMKNFLVKIKDWELTMADKNKGAHYFFQAGDELIISQTCSIVFFSPDGDILYPKLSAILKIPQAIIEELEEQHKEEDND